MNLEFSTTITPEDLKHFEYALGYHELGMSQDALDEINLISSSYETELPVLLHKAQVLNSLQRYTETVLLFGPVIKIVGQHPQFLILLAYATRRAESIDAAYAILARAVESFPKEPLIQYNFACYCAQKGDVESAIIYLKRSIVLDKTFALMALTDHDFDPIRLAESFVTLITTNHK
ncbi:MAG: hypothetical protein SGI71_03405 [Verrucomicrobiota bacterium]|nr:hypothetical protein [Verrucomicrobiota bacterium]